MIDFKVDTTDLLKYANYLRGPVQEKNLRSIAKALNAVGDGVVDEVRLAIQLETGLSAAAAHGMIRTIRATARRLEYVIDLQGIDIDAVSSRRLPRRNLRQGGRTDEFQEGQMVRVITARDDKVCPICEEIAAGSPYTIEEAKANLHHGAPIGENNCRCILVPYVSRRQLPVTGRGIGGSERTGRRINVEQRLTLRQLAATVAREMSGNLRLRVR